MNRNTFGSTMSCKTGFWLINEHIKMYSFHRSAKPHKAVGLTNMPASLRSPPDHCVDTGEKSAAAVVLGLTRNWRMELMTRYEQVCLTRMFHLILI